MQRNRFRLPMHLLVQARLRTPINRQICPFLDDYMLRRGGQTGNVPERNHHSQIVFYADEKYRNA